MQAGGAVMDIIIVGAGPAGYTAAIYAARAGHAPLMITGLQPGGQLMTTTDVENYPGFRNAVQGPWLMEEMQAQAVHAGTEMVNDTITKVDFKQRPFSLTGDSGRVYQARAVIIATGANAKWLGLAAEEKFKGFGVSGCATCDGFFYKNQDVLVVGGGNTAMEEALYLAQLCSSVTIIHRGAAFKGEQILRDRIKKNAKIKVVWDSQLVDIEGEGAAGEQPVVAAAVIENVKDKKRTTIKVSGIFIAIGHAPATDIFRGQIDIDSHGYAVVAPNSTKTNVAGVFAAGDVADSVYRQAVTAAGLGCMAALESDRYLRDL